MCLILLRRRFSLLDFGWAAGGLYYGAGLMVEQPVSTRAAPQHRPTPPDFRQWGAYMGHGGDIYGFLSEQVRGVSE